MAAPKGSPKRGGRQKGTPNKATADVKALYGKDAHQMHAELKRIALNSPSDAARVSAIKEYNDRAYGKAPQAIIGDPEAPIPFVSMSSDKFEEIARKVVSEF